MEYQPSPHQQDFGNIDQIEQLFDSLHPQSQLFLMDLLAQKYLDDLDDNSSELNQAIEQLSEKIIRQSRGKSKAKAIEEDRLPKYVILLNLFKDQGQEGVPYEQIVELHSDIQDPARGATTAVVKLSKKLEAYGFKSKDHQTTL